MRAAAWGHVREITKVLGGIGPSMKEVCKSGSKRTKTRHWRQTEKADC